MLNYLSNCSSVYRIVPREETWFDLADFAGHHLSTPLSPVARLLLTADGSMTQMLEALLFSPVSMVIERQEVVCPGRGITDLAGFEDGEKALAREAWLTAGRRPLIYAHSLLFTSGAGRYTLPSLREVKKPLGRLVRDDGIKTLRVGCRMGLVEAADVAVHLGISPDHEFWGRYYKLTTDQGLTGMIFELFSPELLEE